MRCHTTHTATPQHCHTIAFVVVIICNSNCPEYDFKLLPVERLQFKISEIIGRVELYFNFYNSQNYFDPKWEHLLDSNYELNTSTYFLKCYYLFRQRLYPQRTTVVDVSKGMRPIKLFQKTYKKAI